MKRRDFLKLVAGALAALGLKVKSETESIPETVEAFELPPLHGFWPMEFDGLEAIRACEPQYMCAFNEDTVIESFDGGLTWSEMDAIST